MSRFLGLFSASPLLFMAIIALCFSQASADTHPNIVVILADDLGYGDVQALNANSEIPTPHLNQLSEEGITFLDAHTPSAVCTPTRYGLVTGRYCWRTRLKRGVLNGYGEPLIAEDRITIAEFLQGQGYTTGIVGKWHLGLGFAKNVNGFDFSKPVSDGPHTHGFNESFVIPASLDFPPYVYIQNGKPTKYPGLTQEAQSFPRFLRKGERSPDLVMEDVLDDLAKQASGFIEQQAKTEKPFFLYMPLTAPHKPVWPHPRFEGSTKLGPYGDFVAQVDATVGEVLKTIDRAGIDENTLVFFTSDNGAFMYRIPEGQPDHLDDEKVQGFHPASHTSNGIFRGTKADIWEGGHHVPFFVRWKGKYAGGQTAKETVCLTDIFATVADVIEAELPEEAAPDSFSMAASFTGKTWETPRAPVIHHSANGVFAIRKGDWKLVLANGSGGREKPRGQAFQEPYSLYNMAEDPSETHNVIGSYPEIAASLEKECLRIRDAGRSR